MFRFQMASAGALLMILTLSSCGREAGEPSSENQATEEFQWQTEQFADLRILRYQVPSFEKLSPKQRELVYYLCQAGLSGRDIIWDQNYRHNLEIRDVLEAVYTRAEKAEPSAEREAFEVYTKRVWFSNGIHHHYSNQKLEPGFSKAWFETQLQALDLKISDEAMRAIFDPSFDAKKVNKDPEKGDLIGGSAVNFYEPGISKAEVDAFYAQREKNAGDEPISFGLNSRIRRASDGSLEEEVYRVGGRYGAAIERIVFWLEKARTAAENPAQAKALGLLIDYYKTGDLKTWDAYNIAWVEATEGDVDYINSFIEVYNDPLGRKGSYESVVQIKDFEASDRMKTLSENIEWFEKNAPILEEHKKPDVRGVSYVVVNTAGESGDSSPSTPIGVNLPNANWIRSKHGSKSVSLGNIEHAYDQSAGKGLIEEFAFSQAERERAEKHASAASGLHTALHEVVGHASGRLNPGVGTPAQTLQNYSSTLEEARADLVALYYITDPKLVELGLIESPEVGLAEYESYIRNGLMLQLRRLKPGESLEEDHMRNRQLVAAWVYEKGQKDGVIERKKVEGKTYFTVNDPAKLRILFGDLLREIQRIKSEGDYAAGKALVETYGVKVDAELHAEVLERSAKLNQAPYAGFINPVLKPVEKDGAVVDVEIEYPVDFAGQMLEYGRSYRFLK